MTAKLVQFALSLAAILALGWFAGWLGFARSDPAAPDRDPDRNNA